MAYAVHVNLPMKISTIVQSYFLIESNILEILFVWASPTGDLDLVCLSDGIVNTFCCKIRKNHVL